jgi:hypothetical protein
LPRTRKRRVCQRIPPTRDVVAHTDILLHRREIALYCLDPAGKLFIEDHDRRFRDIAAVLDVLRSETEVERHHPGPCSDDAEVGNEPLGGVVHEVDDLVPLFAPIFARALENWFA